MRVLILALVAVVVTLAARLAEPYVRDADPGAEEVLAEPDAVEVPASDPPAREAATEERPVYTIIDEVTATRNGEAFAVNEEAKAAVIAAGSEVRQLTAEQRQAWVDAMKPVWKQFEDDVPADLVETAQSFNQTN